MKNISNNLVFLFSVAISFLFTYPMDSHSDSFDFIRGMAPGFLFTLFILRVQKSVQSPLKTLAYLLALIILYFFSCLMGIWSWGLALPLIGGISSVLIKKLFLPQFEIFDKTGWRYFMWGSIAGTFGLCFYFFFGRGWPDGFRMGVIILSWQLVFGILWLNQKEFLKEKE